MVLSTGVVAALCFSVSIILILLPTTGAYGDLESDRQALVHFRDNADLERVLASNWTGRDPCAARWRGVTCEAISGTKRVSRLEVEEQGLNGGLPLGTVGDLTELRVLSLKGNALKGRVPSDLSRCTNLRKLYLNLNLFDGPIPDTLSTLHRLDRLLLASNRLTGTIPASLVKLKELLTLRLEVNLLTGPVPDLSGLSKLQDFNVSWNRLSGRIPTGMASRDVGSFVGNNVCGQPVSVSVNCSNSDDVRSGTSNKAHRSDHPSKQLLVILIISGCTALVALLLGLLCCHRCSRRSVAKKRLVAGDAAQEKVLNGAAAQGNALNKPPAADLIFVKKEDMDLFQLDELLRAPAQLLGKGVLGSTYKAVFEGGLAVAVKRLVDRTECSQKLFERRMKIVGKLTHPNLLPLKAYHFYTKLEKLLVYDYMPRGSLHSLLHGSEAPGGNNSLTSSMRLEIAQGVAKCLRFLHHQCKLVHGNIKSSNVLLTEKYEARVCDFGLLPFIPADAKCSSYRAPEVSSSSTQLNRRADVYSYGILLLELLTGKVPQADTSTRKRNEDDLPSWVIAAVDEQALNIEQDMDVVTQEVIMGLFKIALLCISSQPEQRPDMNQVVNMIESINLMVCSPDYSIIHSLY